MVESTDDRDASGDETANAPNQQPLTEVDVATSKSTKSPAFQFYAAEFIADDKVARMSYTEIGMFTILLAHAWLAHGLPVKVSEIGRMLKINPVRFAKIWAGPLSECFVTKGNRLVNPRQERERKKQAEYRKRQQNAAASRWDKPLDSSGTSGGNASLNKSLSSSSSPVSTHTRGGSPIEAGGHHRHAACGRVCVPANLHNDFVRARNHAGADQELRDWYVVVDREWSSGAHAQSSTGGNNYSFWRARFDEKWPAVAVPKKDPRRPAWAV